MDDEQIFKTKIMKKMYSILNDEEMNSEFIELFNKSKIANMNERLENVRSLVSQNNDTEKTYHFIKNIISDNKENIGYGYGLFNTVSFSNMPYSDLIVSITKECKKTLNLDLIKYSKIHEMLKKKLEPSLSDVTAFKKKLLETKTQVQDTTLNTLYNEINKNVQILQTILNNAIAGNPSVSYFVLEIIMGLFRELMILEKVDKESIDFLISFYFNDLSIKSIYLSNNLIMGASDDVIRKFYEYVKILLFNESIFNKYIKSMDSAEETKASNILAKKITEFCKHNNGDLYHTSSRSISMISNLLLYIQSATSQKVKISLETFDYLMMSFISAHRHRMNTVGIMNVLSILSSLNNNTFSFAEKSENEIKALLLSKETSQLKLQENVIELEYLLIHRILNVIFKTLSSNTDIQSNLKTKIKLIMKSCIVSTQITDDKIVEYADKYLEYINSQNTQYPISSYLNLPHKTAINFWWVGNDETLNRQSQNIKI